MSIAADLREEKLKRQQARAAVPPEITYQCLSLSDWLNRDLPEPDFLLGQWLTTTTRCLMYGPTGLGKTMVGFAIAMRACVAAGFLHWSGVRPCRVLYIDGEMSRRLLRKRLAAE